MMLMMMTTNSGKITNCERECMETTRKERAEKEQKIQLISCYFANVKRKKSRMKNQQRVKRSQFTCTHFYAFFSWKKDFFLRFNRLSDASYILFSMLSYHFQSFF